MCARCIGVLCVVIRGNDVWFRVRRFVFRVRCVCVFWLVCGIGAVLRGNEALVCIV